VADIAYVRSSFGFAYAACVTDTCTRKVVGWAWAGPLRTEDLPPQAFNHATWQANSDPFELVASFRSRIAQMFDVVATQDLVI
jgi:transposase InsO family protein